MTMADNAYAMLTQLRRLFCRHGSSMQCFENRRMSLRCPECGHESPGWDVGSSYQVDKPAV